MARRPLPSATLSAALRTRLGLSQQELGDFLGVGAAQVGHVEAGRRGYSAKAQARLHRLAELLPDAPAADGTAIEASGAPAPPTASEARALRARLRARLRACRHEARQLRYQQALWPNQEAALRQRQQTAARLEAALVAPATPAPDAAREQEWLALLRLATARAAQRRPSPTARARLALRLHLLDTEAAGLEQLLGAIVPPGTPVQE